MAKSLPVDTFLPLHGIYRHTAQPYTGCLYIYYVHIPNAGYCIPFCHTHPLPISTQPTSSRWVPPYVPRFCLRFLPDLTGSFSCPCHHCACTKGVQALGSVKRLETILLFWCYINKIALYTLITIFTYICN